MKMDIDAIFYIILSIIILVVSGLGSRRRKQAQQMKATGTPAGRPGSPGPVASKPEGPGQPAMDPFERLEQILTGQTRYESLEGESLEVLEDEEESIVDEEEEVYEAPVKEMKAQDNEPLLVGKEQGTGIAVEGLFKDLDEITRAFIYSEIFPRKYI
jgi:hypothetical protein